MKKIALSLFLALMLLSATACGAKETADYEVEPDSSPVIDTDYEEQEYTYEDPDPYDFLEDTPRSTCFSAVGYDWDTETLYVQFRNSGSIYSYEVPSDVYEELLYADSMGGYYNSYIKGNYPSTKIS